jgi:hypothetical protein
LLIDFNFIEAMIVGVDNRKVTKLSNVELLGEKCLKEQKEAYSWLRV